MSEYVYRGVNYRVSSFCHCALLILTILVTSDMSLKPFKSIESKKVTNKGDFNIQSTC